MIDDSGISLRDDKAGFVDEGEACSGEPCQVSEVMLTEFYHSFFTGFPSY